MDYCNFVVFRPGATEQKFPIPEMRRIFNDIQKLEGNFVGLI